MLSNLQDTLGLGSLLTMALSCFSGKQQQLLQQQLPVVYEPTQPPSYPLAVRNPYLSTWMPSDQINTLPYAESQFWAGQNLTWSIMARVDGDTYSLMGVSTPDEDGIIPAAVRNAEYTATHSVFTLSAGELVFKLDFFSPVSPWNYLRQSLPFSTCLTGGLLRAGYRLMRVGRLLDRICVRGPLEQYPDLFKH